MTPAQSTFLANMTPRTATALINKFLGDPAIAANRSESAYVAFCAAWELLYDEYWQRQNLAGRTEYKLISN